jgi:hypothetical protein
MKKKTSTFTFEQFINLMDENFKTLTCVTYKLINKAHGDYGNNSVFTLGDWDKYLAEVEKLKAEYKKGWIKIGKVTYVPYKETFMPDCGFYNVEIVKVNGTKKIFALDNLDEK